MTTVCVVAQPVLAGGYLSGGFDFLAFHEMNAHAIVNLLFFQAIAAVLYRWPGGGSVRPLLFTIVLLAGAVTQEVMGFDRVLAVHIPLGVFLVVFALYVCVWVWRRGGGTREPVA